LGGVSPSSRKQGVASALLVYQEEWVQSRGYHKLRVKSMNHYPNMMRFLIGKGYCIIGLEEGTPDKLKVHFQKEFKP
jgi:GNAT superfamily N-acetyltransferase